MPPSARSSPAHKPASPALRWLENVRPVVFGLLLVALLTFLLVFDILPRSHLDLRAGDEAPEDVLAPQSVTYISEVLTEKARQEAIAGVRDVYDPPDMRVARAQVSRTRLILDFIETVRADTLASQQLEDRLLQKQYVNAVPELELADETLDTLLSLTASQWETVRDDTLNVVDEAMREQIREGRLQEAKAAIPLSVRLELPENEAAVVTALAQQLIVPNSSLNPQLTEQGRLEAATMVEPVQQTFAINTPIVRQGDIIDEADIEAMQQLGLLAVETDWRSTASLFVAVVLIIALLGLYVLRLHPEFFSSGRHMALLSALLIMFTLGAKLLVPGQVLLPFLYPAAGLAMLLTVLFDPNLAIAITISLAAVVGFIGGNSLELTVYAAVGGIISALVIRKSPRISTFFRTGILVGVANTCVILVYRLSSTDLRGLLELVGVSFLNGLLSSGLTLTGFFVVGNVFNVVTALQLQELARLDHPLLQELLRQAPGTYHHSLMVANLAEQAARQIGADAPLVRVGSFYHDVGKIARPYFFTENQGGTNAHARLDPRTSAQTIVNHVADGLELARRYRLPEKIRSFIPEHQGTRTTKLFYNQALKAAADPSLVDEQDYKYPGPKPQSRETGVVLLADSCEAASTAMQSSTVAEIAELVDKIVDDIVLQGELDESGLTLGDIRIIKQSFAETLQGRFHVRPKYPGQRTSDQLGPLVAAPANPAEEKEGVPD
jgi:putative nucleotidyltransferase with HDIG domain